jgi:hypothetical protein
MKRLLVIGFVVASLLTRQLEAAEGKFTAGLSPADLAAAGLSSLTPEQLARLNTLVEDYKNGAVASTARLTEPAASANQPAEIRSAPAPVQSRAARSSQPKPASSGGLIAQTRDWLKHSAQGPAPVSESTVVGKFRGWEPKQVMTLANGERWRVANADTYYTPVVENPRVVVAPSSMGGYWMEFPDLKVRVRVNPLE